MARRANIARKPPQSIHFGIANPFGLSDMHGNVLEWCQDPWHSNYEGAPNDGSVWPGDSSSRVRRGGSWNFIPRNCRSAYRNSDNADYRTDNIGFRVCCSAPRT
jgi:formylglycine-generating enzyme required for sulfatase activity